MGRYLVFADRLIEFGSSDLGVKRVVCENQRYSINGSVVLLRRA